MYHPVLGEDQQVRLAQPGGLPCICLEQCWWEGGSFLLLDSSYCGQFGTWIIK